MSNRVIKFRAWDSKNNQMMFSGLHDKNWYTESKSGLCIQGKHQDDVKLPIMQFTGLHDKNSVEIYEGDVLSSPHFVDSAGREHELNHIVQWSDKFQSWFLLNVSTMREKEGSVQMWLANGVEVTVIGNIHENPELLESKS